MDLVSTGGSRADGTVNLSYEYGFFQQPVLDETLAETAANQSCSGWGYTGSKPFGGRVEKCELTDGNGACMRFLVTVTYQCTGAPSASH